VLQGSAAGARYTLGRLQSMPNSRPPLPGLPRTAAAAPATPLRSCRGSAAEPDVFACPIAAVQVPSSRSSRFLRINREHQSESVPCVLIAFPHECPSWPISWHTRGSDALRLGSLIRVRSTTLTSGYCLDGVRLDRDTGEGGGATQEKVG